MVLHYLKSLFKIITALSLGILLTRTFVIEAGRVNGISMEPTYLDAQLFFVNKFSLLFSEPYRGEIVQARDMWNKTIVIKRVIGLPGEQVSIRDNRVYITTAKGVTFTLYEPYLSSTTITQSADRMATDYQPLGMNEYFLMGDNRRESHDSRDYGPVPRDNILGSIITGL